MFLSRHQFVIHDGSSETLDDLAEFAMQLFDYLPDSNRLRPVYSLSLNLHGVPRGQLAAVQKELESRLEPLGFKANLFGPPGTCTVTTDETEFNISPVPGLGVSHLEGKPCDGLILELRLTIRGYVKSRVEIDSTLVLVGELNSGLVEIRAVWREGSHGDPDKNFQNSHWPQDGQFWSLFEEFQEDDLRETKETLQLAQVIFPKFKDEQNGLRIQRYVLMPFRLGHPRHWGILLRALAWSSLAILGVFLLIKAFTSDISIVMKTLSVSITLFLVGPLVLFLIHEICLIWLIWRGLSTRFNRLYRQESQQAESGSETVTEHTSNCNFQQVAEELREKGYRLLGNQELRIESDKIAVMSMFVNERECTDVGVMSISEDVSDSEQTRIHYWPINLTLATRSKFTNGWVNVLFNSYADAWRRRLPGNYQMRFETNLENLEQHLQLHKQWCEDYMQQHGVSLVARSYDEIVHMQKERLKQEYEYFRKKPFSLGDFLNFYLQRTRSAYRF